jgi:hypothetical protein
MVNSGASWDAAYTGKHFPTLPESLRPPFSVFNPLYAKLNPICHLLALLESHHILHVSRIRVKWSKQSAFFGIKMEAVSSSVTFDHGDIVSRIVYITI